jgi:hypothetical protein
MDEEDKELLGLGSDLATHSNFDSLDGRQRQKQDLIDYSKYEAIGSYVELSIRFLLLSVPSPDHYLWTSLYPRPNQ